MTWEFYLHPMKLPINPAFLIINLSQQKFLLLTVTA